MKKVLMHVCVSFVLFILVSSAAYAQASVPAFPDYSKWQKSGAVAYPAIHNGQQVKLNVEAYNNTDFVNLKRHTLVLIYNEKNNLWFALLTVETGERRPDGSVGTKEAEHYLFENHNSKWVFGRSFQDGQNLDKETTDFIKSKYNLEFVH